MADYILDRCTVLGLKLSFTTQRSVPHTHQASRFGDVLLNTAKVIFEAVREWTHIT
jgi:hypothetical protein